jgi:hypothetical protein
LSPHLSPVSQHVKPYAEPYIEPHVNQHDSSYAKSYAEPHIEPYVEPRVHVECAAIEPELEPAKKLRTLGLNKLWVVEALHFPVKINGCTTTCLLDSSSEVNVLPYAAAISLSLSILSDVRHDIMERVKDAPFCGYVPEVPICIGGVTVRQPFFISRSSYKCVLGRPFEAATRMMRQTMDDGSVHMALVMQDQDVVIVQPYTPGSAADLYGYEIVWREPVDEDFEAHSF